jgi:hypothetical protein
VLLVAACGVPLAAQDTKAEFWPEADIFVNYGPRIRFLAIDSLSQDQNTKERQGSFSYYADFAMKPFFRRDLRGQEDVFRKRYFTFRAGFQYSTSFVTGDASSEKMIIAESTSRIPMPGKIVVFDRNRGDFRFVSGKAFSVRYRNRLWAERDVAVWRFAFTPYVNYEIDYDLSRSAWNPKRYAAGLQFPVQTHVVIEPNYTVQNDRLDLPHHIHAVGLTLGLYF